MSVMHDELTRSLGQNIRAERARRGMSQEQLAEMSGLHRTYIGVVERAEKHITVTNCLRIARALNLTLSDLIHMSEERYPGCNLASQPD